MKISLPAFIPAFTWFVIASVLFLLPGEQLPEEDLFKLPDVDKLIHTFLFFVLCILFYRPFRFSHDRAYKQAMFAKIALAAVIYGLIIEVLQKYFIPNRSFDLWDLVFDAIGCGASYWYGLKFYQKHAAKK